MPKHLLFIVHGMGPYVDENNEPNNTWHDSARDAFKNVFDARLGDLFTDQAGPGFDDRVEPVYIHYDDIFHNYLARNDDHAQILAEIGGEANPFGFLTNWLDGSSELEDNMLWTHWGDVILYTISPLVRETVKVHVAKQIFDKLKEYGDEHGAFRWSVLAHSLGTAVTSDALHALKTNTIEDGNIGGLDLVAQSAAVVGMLANVCKPIEMGVNILGGGRDLKVYENSTLIPSLNNPGTAVGERYVTARHTFDILGSLIAFKPEESNNVAINARWTALQNAAPPAYTPEKLLNISIPDGLDGDTLKEKFMAMQSHLHSFEHYIEFPEVYVPILNAIYGDCISQSRKLELIEEHRQSFRSDLETIAKVKLEEHLEKLDLYSNNKQNLEKVFTWVSAMLAGQLDILGGE